MSCFGVGHLSVMPLCAKLGVDTEFGGNMDTYCKCAIGNTSFQTRIFNGSGKNPTWSDTLTFRVHGENVATICVYSGSNFGEDYLGEAHLQLHEVYTKGIFSNWYALTKNCHLTGQIMIQFEFHSEKDKNKEKKEKQQMMQQPQHMQPQTMIMPPSKIFFPPKKSII